MGTMIQYLATLGFMTGAGVAAAQTYSITELPTLGVPNGFHAAGINNGGELVGSSAVSGGDTYHAFVFTRGAFHDLGTLGGRQSFGYGINDRGEVTGTAYLSDDVTTHAFLFSGGRMHDLGALGGGISNGAGINNKGEVTGSSLLADKSTYHTFVYSHGAMHDIGAKAGNNSGASINDRGQVTGKLTLADGNTYHAFLYTNGSFQDLGTVGGFLTSGGTSVNAQGEVAGTLGNFSPHSAAAFLYRNGSLHRIQTSNISEAAAINDSGQLVGARAIGSVNAMLPGIAILADGEGRAVDLQTLIDPKSALAPYVTLTSASGITNSGYIVANGSDSRHAGVTETFLLKCEDVGYRQSVNYDPGRPACPHPGH